MLWLRENQSIFNLSILNWYYGVTAVFPCDIRSLSLRPERRSLIFEQGKVLTLQISKSIFYIGNEGLLQELAVILLSHAIQYSGPGSEITVPMAMSAG